MPAEVADAQGGSDLTPVSPLQAALDRIYVHLDASSPSELDAKAVWKQEVLLKALRGEEGAETLTKEEWSLLVTSIFLSLTQYHTCAQRHAVDDVVRLASRHEQAYAHFVPLLVRQLSKVVPAVTGKDTAKATVLPSLLVSSRLLRWTCALFRGQMALEASAHVSVFSTASKKVLDWLVNAQAVLVGSLSVASGAYATAPTSASSLSPLAPARVTRVVRTTVTQLRSTFTLCASVMPSLSAALGSLPASPPSLTVKAGSTTVTPAILAYVGKASLSGALASVALSSPSFKASDHVKAYTLGITGANLQCRPSPLSFECWQRFLASHKGGSDEKLFKAEILPQVVRLLKRSPELCMVSVESLFSSLTLDIGDSVKADLLPSLVSGLKSNNVSLCALTAKTIASLTRRCADPAVVSLILTQVIGSDCLKWKPDQRTAALSAARGIWEASALKEKKADVALAAADLYTTFVERESTEELKVQALLDLAQWAGALTSLPVKLSALLTKSLDTSKNTSQQHEAKLVALRHGLLHVLDSFATSTGNHAAVSKLIPMLFRLVGKKGPTIARHTSRVDALLSLRVLLRLAATDAAVAAQLAKDKVFEFVNSTTSFLHSLEFLERYLTVGDALPSSSTPAGVPSLTSIASGSVGVTSSIASSQALIDVFTRMVETQFSQLTASSSGQVSSLTLFSTAVFVMTSSPVTLARSRARQSVHNILGSKFDATSEVSHSLLSAISFLLLDNRDEFLKRSAATGSSGVAAALMASLAVTTETTTTSNDDFIAIITLAHSPAVCPSSRSARAMWRAVSQRMWQSEGPSYSKDLCSNLAKVILGERWLTNASHEARLTACRVLVAAANDAPEIVLSDLLPRIQASVRPSQLIDITHEDLSIYHTSEGELYKDPVGGDGVYRARQVVDKNAVRTRGMKMTKEEREWEMKQQKKNASSTENPKEKQEREMREKRHAEEAAVRARVHLVGLTINGSLQAFIALASEGSDESRRVITRHLPSLFPRFLSLLPSSLVGPSSRSAIVAVMGCVDVSLRVHAADLVSMIDQTYTAMDYDCDYHTQDGEVDEEVLMGKSEIAAAHSLSFRQFVSFQAAEKDHSASTDAEIDTVLQEIVPNMPLGRAIKQAMQKLFDRIRVTLSDRHNHAFSAGDFSVLLPLLARVVASNATAPSPVLQERIFQISSPHLAILAPTQRRVTTHLLLSLLVQALRLEARIITDLCTLCRTASCPSDVSPLFGNSGLFSNITDARAVSLRALAALPCMDAIVSDDAEAEHRIDHVMSKGGLARASLTQAQLDEWRGDSFLVTRLWVSLFDEEEAPKAEAAKVWQLLKGKLPNETFAPSLLPLLAHDDDATRHRVAHALAQGMIQLQSNSATSNESAVQVVLAQLSSLYKKHLPGPDAELEAARELGDTVGVERILHLHEFDKEYQESLDKIVDQRIRDGAARVFGSLAVAMTSRDVPGAFLFLVNDALHDPRDSVRATWTDAGLSVIREQGAKNTTLILPIVESYLAKSVESTYQSDRVRTAVVILLAGVSQFLSTDDARISSVIERLIETLNTPSEAVQKAVAKSIAPLLRKLYDAGGAGGGVGDVQKTADRLLQILSASSSTYASRRGAAYGIAGLVKGCGLRSLQQCNIMPTLLKNVAKKGNTSHRQGALFSFECLSRLLGRLFEPFVGAILPQLLKCYGDGSGEVREATSDAAKEIMGQLTAFGVKVVLPALLRALKDKQWRTKTAACQLLGSMAYCAPRQLSACLPTTVPKLVKILCDTHDEVQEAARTALRSIGSVVRNREIQAHVQKLLAAIEDASEFNIDRALNALLTTDFVNAIDAPSLAIVMPMLIRALQLRKPSIKCSAAQVAASMASLTTVDDLCPYVPALISALKAIIADPTPEVRATSSKALGALVKGLPADTYSDLLPWLMKAVQAKGSGKVNREGAAQAFSEVLAAMESGALSTYLPQVLLLTSDRKAHVRDGGMAVFIFLPSAMGRDFEKHISIILPHILEGLADDQAESVRDTSLRAAQALVAEFAQESLDTLLPPLQDGLFNDQWRIRLSSVLLLRDLLCALANGALTEGDTTAGGARKLARIEIEPSKGKGGDAAEPADEAEEEDGEDFFLGEEDRIDEDAFVQQSASAQSGTGALDEKRRNQVLSALYMVRADVNPTVKRRAILVWKAVVVNTPKTLREIVPTLLRMLVTCLSSDSEDRRDAAGRTLGDLVQRGNLGERVIQDALPILSDGLKSSDPCTREGVCIGLSEVIACAKRHQIGERVQEMVPSVRRALCDNDERVRDAAARVLDQLHRAVGQDVWDEVIPPLLADLEKENLQQQTLQGIEKMVEVRGKGVLHILVPRLLDCKGTKDRLPMDTATRESAEFRGVPAFQTYHALAIASVSSVAGDLFTQHVGTVLSPLVRRSAQCLAAHNVALAAGDDVASALALSYLEHMRTAIDCVMLSTAADSVHIVMMDMAVLNRSKEVSVRCETIGLLGRYCRDSKLNLLKQMDSILPLLLSAYGDSAATVNKEAVQALSLALKSLSKETYPKLVATIRDCIRMTWLSGVSGSPVILAAAAAADTASVKAPPLIAGFSLPRALSSMLPVFTGSLMSGTAEVKERAAEGLGELVCLTSAAALKPYVLIITGPLIRVIGDRVPPFVKSAILATLELLLAKAGILLKAFLPQLQTSFVKALNDPTQVVRERAASALGRLMKLNPRVDPLVIEICSGVDNTSGGVKQAMLQALNHVMVMAGTKVGPKAMASVRALSLRLLSDTSEEVRCSGARVLGAYCSVLKDDFDSFVSEQIFATWEDGNERHGHALALATVVKRCAPKLTHRVDDIVNLADSYAQHDNFQIKECGFNAAASALSHCAKDLSTTATTRLCAIFTRVWTSTSETNDVKLIATTAAKRLGKGGSKASSAVLLQLVPSLMPLTKQASMPLKMGADRCLLYLLEVHTNPSALASYQQAGGDRSVADHCRKVISKLSDAASDDEGDF